MATFEPAFDREAAARVRPMPLGALLAEPVAASLPLSMAAIPIAHVATDSRQCVPGSLFAAIRGQHHDGHDHVESACARGAAFVLSERPLCGVAHAVVPAPALAVSLAASRLYADWVRPLTLVGLTGTNGKTTCAHLVGSMLAEAHGQAAAIGTLGTSLFRRGAPMALVASKGGLTTPEAAELWRTLVGLAAAGVRHVAIEATSIGLLQGRLAHLAFDVVALSNLSQDHLDVHGTMDAYRAAKRLLFVAHRRGARPAVCNADDPFGREVAAAHAPSLTFSQRAGQGDVCALSVDYARAATCLSLATPQGPLTLTSPLVGPFNAENLLLAASVGLALELVPATIARGIAALAAVPGRLERVGGGPPDAPTVLVDFAHTPAALAKALAAAADLTRGGRLLCVFGCGGDRDRSKRPQMGAVAAQKADWSVVTSDNPRTEPAASIVDDVVAGLVAAGATQAATPPAAARRQPAGSFWPCVDRAQAIAHALAAAASGDVVLLAGKGHEDYQIVGTTKLPFDDRAVARQALTRWRPPGRPSQGDLL